MNTLPRNPGPVNASLAIRGMPPGEISDKMEAYENLFDCWLGVKVDDAGHVVEQRWFSRFRGFLCYRIARTPVGIFRAQVADLAIACAKLMNDARGAQAREQFYKQYCKMVEENRELRSFLGEHFRIDLLEAEARNISIPLLIKEILLRQKKQQ